jgi:hypothetical protein
MWSYTIWLRALGVALATTLYMPAAHAQRPMDQPVTKVEAALGKILGCSDWSGNEKTVGCGPKQTGFSTFLDRDSADGTVKTIETGGILEWDDNRDPKQGAVTRRTMQEVFAYLFPHWHGRKAWLDRALHDVLAREKSVTKVGKLTILVEYLHPADYPVTVADIYVTKLPSIEQWVPDE